MTGKLNVVGVKGISLQLFSSLVSSVLGKLQTATVPSAGVLGREGAALPPLSTGAFRDAAAAPP